MSSMICFGCLVVELRFSMLKVCASSMFCVRLCLICDERTLRFVSIICTLGRISVQRGSVRFPQFMRWWAQGSHWLPFCRGVQGVSIVDRRRVTLTGPHWVRSNSFDNRGRLRDECPIVRQVVTRLVDARGGRVGRYPD